MDTGRHKGRRICPNMKHKKSVELGLNMFKAVTEPDPLGREIDVGRKKEHHAQVACAGRQVIIRHIRVYGRQHRKTHEHRHPFPERPAAE